MPHMSRDFRDDPDDNRRDAPPTPAARERTLTTEARRWSPSDRLTLPRGPSRQPVIRGRERYTLRDSEVDLLSTIGTFRAVQVSDLESLGASRSGHNDNRTQADLRSLREQGLLQTHSLVINRRPELVAVLTDTSRELLERSRATVNHEPGINSALRTNLEPPTPNSEPRMQRFYSGLVKPRDLAHDAQLYRMFETERKELAADGATVTRVVLDYELKADYHRYVHEEHLAGVDAIHARCAFADEHDLPFANEHIHFPDVRVEYTSADGHTAHRDLELATEHYSRSQLRGTQAAGFRVCRAAGAGAGAGRRGTPFDPHHLQWLS
jgi:hypothetical protein